MSPSCSKSLRRYSDRIDIFCQAGQIALPSTYRPIVAYLEAAVHPVTPANPHRIFHPKVWALRYTREDSALDLPAARTFAEPDV